MTTDIKATQTLEAMLTDSAEGILDGIKAEPVPPEILDLALRLQAKFDEKSHQSPQAPDSTTADGA